MQQFLQEAEIGKTVIREELSNMMLPIQRNDLSNTQSAPQRKSPHRKPQMEQSGRNSDLSTWRIVSRGSSRRGNRELNVTGTSKVSGNLNGVQRIMDIFVGGL